MSASDLFTILSILLAVYALLPSEHRKYYHLKFNWFHWCTAGFLLLYIHFLISFSWWASKSEWIRGFYWTGWPISGAYAYLFSLLLIGYVVWRLNFAYYAGSKVKSLIELYNQLIYNKDYELLRKLVEKFHNPYANNYFKKLRSAYEKISVEGVYDLIGWKNQRDREEEILSEFINEDKLKYTESCYHVVITNESFIHDSANEHPHLFCPWIENLNTQELSNPDFLNGYLRTLFKKKNRTLFKEIRGNQNFKDSSRSYRIEQSRYILYALFNDINVSIHNEVWRGVGEETIYELIAEQKLTSSSLREKESEQDEYDDTIWSYRIKNGIWFFDIMVREAINQGAKKHMWMYYYSYFVRELLNNMSDENDNSKTRNFDLIESIFSKILEWVTVIVETQHTFLTEDVFKCFAWCVHEVIISDKLKIETKGDLAKGLFHKIIRTHTSPDKSGHNQEVLDLFMDNLINVYANPPISYCGDDLIKYTGVLRWIWDNRDRSSEHHEERIERFEAEVINKYL